MNEGFGMDTEGGDMSVTPIDEATNVPIADPVTPVAANAPVYQVEPVDPVETETPGVVEISNQARELATEYLRDATTRRNNAVEAEQEIIAENNQSVRDLMRALRDYDNSLAVTRYLNYIRTAAAYGTLQNALPDYDAIVSGASNAVYNLNNRVNNLNNYVSNTPPPVVRDSTPALSVRDNMIRSVDNWLAGTGVFQPGMQNFPSSEGFRFTPLAPEAYEVYNAAEVLATDNRDLIANYLTRLANLTPLNFIFYDPTGLGPLSIIERREFITTADELLEEAEIEVRASELVYNFVDESTIDIDTEWEVAEDFHQKVLAALNHGSGPDDPRVALLHRLGSRISTYA